MKNYLNKAEREDYCVVALSVGKFEEMLKNWERNLTPQEHRALSTAKTYIYKFMDSVQGRMNNDFVPQLVRDIRASEILVLPKYQAQQEFKNRALDDGFVKVDKETILNMAEHALVGCEGCTKCDWEKCDLRQAYMELDIDPYNPETAECQYKVEYNKKAV